VAHKISKALVFTLGFDVTHVLTRLAEIGLEGKKNSSLFYQRTKKKSGSVCERDSSAHKRAQLPRV